MTFALSHAAQIREKKEKAEKEVSQRKEAYKAGKTHGISGRELFEFNPDYVEGDDDEAGDDDVIILMRNEVGQTYNERFEVDWLEYIIYYQ